MISSLLAWFARHGRELPWREEIPDPYHVWLSEIMLQQTRIEAVKEAYARILQICPTVGDLAALPEEALLKLWQGLGYYSRARNLHAAAKKILSEGRFPQNAAEWRKLPGVGEYTAGAIASIVWNESVPAVDGNVLRVLSRLRAEDLDRPAATALLREWLSGVTACGAFTQAWMELGEIVCIPNGAPHCCECPLAAECRARRMGCIGDFPKSRAKPARPVTEWTVFRIHPVNGQEVLLRMRPARGLLAKMWEFPNVEGMLDEKGIRTVLGKMGLEVRKICLLPATTHLFTHREWRMTNYDVTITGRAEVEAPYVWATPRDLEEKYAVPSAFRGMRDTKGL